MTGIKAALCVLVIAMSVSSVGLRAADGVQNNARNSAGASDLTIAIPASPAANFSIGGIASQPTAKKCLSAPPEGPGTTLEAILCLCAKQPEKGPLTACISAYHGDDWDDL